MVLKQMSNADLPCDVTKATTKIISSGINVQRRASSVPVSTKRLSFGMSSPASASAYKHNSGSRQQTVDSAVSGLINNRYHERWTVCIRMSLTSPLWPA